MTETFDLGSKEISKTVKKNNLLTPTNYEDVK